jgi:hypothetical protein
MSTSDPFSANVLKHLLSPKIVSDGAGGYDVKVDITNVDTIYVSGDINGYSPPYVHDELTVVIGNGSGTNGSIVTSTDGQNWSPANLPSQTRIFDAVYNGSYWIGIGAAGGSNFFMSFDGINWTNTTQGTNNNRFSITNCIGWNGQYWLAGGLSNLANSSILKSVDGRNWNLTTYFFDECIKVAWNGKYWVGVGRGSSGTIGISYDGNTWTAPTGTNPNFFDSGLASSIAWNGNYWLAIGGGPLGSIAISYDGQNWAPSTNDFFAGGIGRSVAWNGEYWIAVGNGNNGTIGYSFDGQSWNASNNNFFARTTGFGIGNDIIWTGSYWVATGDGDNGNIGISNIDPSAWTAPTGPPPGFLTDSGTIVRSKNIWINPKPLTLQESITRIGTFLSKTSGVSI